MNWLHAEGLVSDSDIMRDECNEPYGFNHSQIPFCELVFSFSLFNKLVLNVYNVFLNECFLKTVSMYSSDEQSCLGIGESSRIER